jgi:hypothetical protein
MNTGFSLLELQAFANQLYQGRPLVMVPYGYTVTFAGLTANATQTQTLSITANADFILTKVKSRTTIAAAAQTISNLTAPQMRVLITDSGSNEQFTNQAVDLVNYSTIGQSDIGNLPYPRFISGRTSLSIVLSEYGGVVATENVDLFLEGLLIRTYSGQ